MSKSRLPDPTPDVEHLVEKIFTERHQRRHAPASMFLLKRVARELSNLGFGDIDGQQTAPTADTAFRIASCTKSFTAALVLLLRDAGLVDLDRPVQEYLPVLSRWTLPSPGSAKPTARMLLSMSAGLATDNEWADRQESMSATDFEAMLARGVSFVSEPGTAFEYSNLGYAILGRLVERVTGHSYVNLVRTRLLEPLGLHTTDFVVPFGAANHATGFVRCHGDWEPLTQPGPGAFSAIGGIHSTANDLARWGSWLCSAFDPALDGSEGILSKASRREMQQIHRHIPGRVPVTGYGYGLFISHDEHHGQVVSHSGGYPGFSSHMRWQTSSGVLAIGLENATYAAVHAPVAEAFEAALAHTPTASASAKPWPQTLAARAAVESLLRQWDGRIVSRWFTENVAQDKDWDTRRAELDALLQLTGALEFAAGRVEEATPAGISWVLPGERGTLRCSILMHPLVEPLIQRLNLELVQERPTDDG